MKNSFLSASIIYFIGNILLKGIAFFTLPIFSRIMLPEDFGQYSLYTASLGILSIFMGLQINGTVNISFRNKSIERFESYVSNITLVPLMGLFIGLLLLLLLPNFIDLIQVPSFSFGIMMMIQTFFSIVTSIYQSELVIKSQPKKHFIFSIIATLVNVFLSLSFVLMLKNHTYFARVISGVLSNALIGLYVLIKYLPRINTELLKSDWIDGLKLSLPLIFHNLSNQLLNVADRYMIAYWSNAEDVAIYSFTYTLGSIMDMIWLSINNAWIPWYFSQLKDNNKRLIKLYCKQYIIFFIWLTCCFLLITPELIYLMGGKQYIYGIYIIPLIVLGYFFVFLYSFFVNYQFYLKKTTLIPIATTSAAIINILLNKLLIPQFGIMGAALTTVVSYFLMLVFHCFMTRYVLKYRDIPMKYFVVSIIFMIGFIVLLYLLVGLLFIRWIFIILLCIIYGTYLLRLIKHKGGIINEIE